MYGCESWTVKKAEPQGIDAFELWCWRRLLRVPWTDCKEISPVNPKGNHPCPKDSQESFPPPQFKSINTSMLSLLYGPTLTSVCDYWKNHGLTICIFVGRVVSLLLNTLPRFVTVFLPRSKCVLIS